MMRARGGVGIGVPPPLDPCKCFVTSEFEEAESSGWVRALRVDRTARNHGRRSLII